MEENNVHHNCKDMTESQELEHLMIELKGNTLLLYWFLLRHNRPFGAREIQRKVGLSSSSLALHHLNKLIDLGLVKTNEDGGYVIARIIKPGLLSMFIGYGRTMIPRFVPYAIFNSTLLVSCMYLFWGHIDAVIILLYASLLISATTFWVESYRLWKIQLF
jgi:predicted DNA-binding transcriptional regulator